ncbi:MAG: GNAT family N-acetyltransferase [Verrucomicrobiota bacterium]
MDFRIAELSDLDLLGKWNRELIEDEAHSNPMNLDQLKERMKNWIEGDKYVAHIFSSSDIPVAYSLHKEKEEEIYLRQFFVDRSQRRKGYGKLAVSCLKEKIWPQNKRLTLDVLSSNERAIDFWRAVGYQDYCVTLEIPPPTKS